MITIIIATKDRPELIYRFLNYLVSVDYRHSIVIGDSSVDSFQAKMKEVVMAFGGKLSIKYLDCKGAGVIECHRHLLGAISTPYVVCISDGSFLVPQSLEKCVDFLERNPDYSIAHGRGALFTLTGEGPYGKIDQVDIYPLPIQEEESAVQRLSKYLKNYTVTMYCVYRSEIWKKAWQSSFTIKDRAFAGELLPGCLTVVYGKAKELDCLYMMRHMHSRRVIFPNIDDWIGSEHWQSSYQSFCNVLAEALVQKDGIAIDKAKEVIKEVFWDYVKRGIDLQNTNGKGNNQWGKRAKHILKRIPAIRKTARVIKSVAVSSKNIAWPSLLRKGSFYHADFMPIYEIVKEPSDFGKNLLTPLLSVNNSEARSLVSKT